MTTVIQLPGGVQAELHDKVTVKGRWVLAPAFTEMIRHLIDRFPNLKDFAKVDLSDAELATTMLGHADGPFVAASMEFQKASIVAFVKSWTLGPLPTMDTLGDLIEDPDVYDALAAAVAPLAVGSMRRQDWGPAGAKDPDSPTGPSSASNGGLRAEEPQTTLSTGSTPPPANGSESSDTGVCFT